MEDTRSSFRKIVSITVGLLMLAGGLAGILYLLLFAAVIKGWLWVGAGFIAAIGGLILWEDIRPLLSRSVRSKH